MAVDKVPSSDLLSSSDRFAALIGKDAASILALFQRSIGSSDPVPAGLGPHDHAGVNAAGLIADLVERVHADDVRVGAPRNQPAWQAKRGQVNGAPSAVTMLEAAASFFTSTVIMLARHVEDDPGLLRSFVAATLALNEGLTLMAGNVTVAHTRQMLARIHEARLDERRRIARELHDRLGEELSVALRRLELSELIAPKAANETTVRASLAREALVQAMDKVRLITSDLRQDPVISLEQALRRYRDSVVTDADVRLRFRGNEQWASSAVLDEAYLIIREAMRNALAHAAPRTVTITVTVEHHWLRALVADDGRGFLVTPLTSGNARGNVGLASMRERAFLIGGRIHISSVPGHGTQVELIVPLKPPS